MRYPTRSRAGGQSPPAGNPDARPRIAAPADPDGRDDRPPARRDIKPRRRPTAAEDEDRRLSMFAPELVAPEVEDGDEDEVGAEPDAAGHWPDLPGWSGAADPGVANDDVEEEEEEKDEVKAPGPETETGDDADAEADRRVLDFLHAPAPTVADTAAGGATGAAGGRGRDGAGPRHDGRPRRLSPYQSVAGETRKGTYVPRWIMDVTPDDSERLFLAHLDFWLGLKPTSGRYPGFTYRAATYRIFECEDGSPPFYLAKARLLANQLGKDVAAIRRLIRKLAARGLIVAEPDVAAGTRIRAGYRLRLNWPAIEAILARDAGTRRGADDAEDD